MSRDVRLDALSALAIAAAVALAMGRATSAGFMWLDDGLYVDRNAQVLAGLSWDGVAWAFGEGAHGTYFHPLTWLSLMADVQLFGPDPVALHAVNLALHAATAVLFFLVARRATGRRGPALAAALLFAIHPLGVESAVWITERKQVLGTALGMGAALAWVSHLTRPARWRLALAAALLAASVLAKPHLVVLPALLLLVDLWPLRRLAPLAPEGGRFAPASPARLVLEKWPLWAVSAAGAALVISRMPDVTNVGEDVVPWRLRLPNAVARIADYAGAVVWPRELTVFRPFPFEVPPGEVVLGAAVLVLVSASAVLLLRNRPWLLVGWAWFLVALAPVSGVLQTGLWPAWADRFAYVPVMGVALAVAFEGAAWAERSRGARAAVLGAGAAALLALGATTRAQVEHWQSSASLFGRAAAKAPWHAGVRTMYGIILTNDGRLAEALLELEASRRLVPDYPPTLRQIGDVQRRMGKVDAAAAMYRETLRYAPDDADTHFELGYLAWQEGWTDVADFHLRRYLQVQVPDARRLDQWAIAYLKGLARHPPGTRAPRP